MSKKPETFFGLMLAGLFLISLVVAYGHSRYAAQGSTPPQQRQGGGPARPSPQDLEALGLVNALSQEQTDELVRQGWSRGAAHVRFGQFGIDAATVEALKSEGVDFARAREQAGEDPAFWDAPDHTAYLIAAADAVVTGEVAKVRYTNEGPYHTEVYVKVDKSYKHDLTGRMIQLNQVAVGVTTNERGERLRYRASFEPEFKEGERVLLFLSETPRALRSLYTQARARSKGDDDERLVRGFGPKAKVEQALQSKSAYEVQAAYKIVNDKAVSKSDAFYATTNGHELALADVDGLSQKVRAAEARAGRRHGAPRSVAQIPQ